MPVKKGSLFAPNGRPLSISSLDSEELQSGEQSPYDIAGLEKEGENLARKAAKRLKKNYASHSESFLEKFIGWHAKKKVDKVKSKLDSLFPRLKNSESTIRTWLASVSERKEQAWSHGSSLLIDMENQIRLYQQHLDFLDEVVNDIRQIDYDILREVTELRIAFAFNQELLNRPSPKPSFVLKTTDRADVVHITVGGGGGGGGSSAAASNSINDDIDKEQFSEPAVWQAFGTAHGKVVGAQPPAVLNKKPPKTIISSLMNSVSHAHSGTPPPGAMPGEAKASPRSVPTLTSQRNSFNGRSSKPVVLTVDAKSVDGRSEAVLTGANKSHAPGRKGSVGGGPGHRSTNSLDGGLENLMWDGENDKRKALSISCVSLQSLKLGAVESPVHGGSGSPITTPSSGGSASGKSATPKGSSLRDLLPASFARSHSASFTGSGPEMTQIGVGAATRGRSGSLNGGARDCSTPPSIGQSKAIQVLPQPSTPITRARTGPSSFSFDLHQHYSSSDDSTASHSDDDPPTPPDMGVHIVTPKAGGGRKSFSGADGGGVSSVSNGDLSKKLSLHKLLLKVDSHEYDLDHLNTTDEDQLEMAKRIKKCLALKDTLKSVLSTVQTTQDNETLTLKRMKKLKNELKSVVSTDEIMTGSKDEYHTINQALLATGGYYINSNSGSNNNLQTLNYSSDDNGAKFREMRAYSNTPPTLLQQSLHSNNTSLYGIGSGSGSRRNSSPIPMVRQGSESSQSGHHFAPSERIPIPSATRVTPSQSAAVAASGVAAYSFMTTATTGSEAGKATGEGEEDKLSIRSRSPSIDGEHLNFEEAAIECVDDLKALIQQETEAKAKLAKLTSLIDNANQINQQLMLTTSPSKVK